jgi:hypothetical protein
MKRYLLVALVLLLGAAAALVGPRPRTAHIAPLAQPAAISPWGLNVYLTKRDRLSTGDDLNALAASARATGASWTLEEFPWALIEPGNDDWRTIYDAGIRQAADHGFGIIGMLLTTPTWARDAGCADRASNYWCAPADVNQYAQFAGWMAERYDGDGVADAPGSPRVAAWQIWNEPNDVNQWPLLNGSEAARRGRYGQMLVAAYAAIKAADPSAVVVAGGVYIFDGGHGDGIEFLGGAFGQVPAAKQSFDIFGIHPYMPTIAPDNVGTYSNVTLEGRLATARSWLSNDVGRPDAPIWITEIGWCTSGSAACPAVSVEQQARYLIRTFVIAQHHGVQHINWLQFEDAFNGGHPFSGSAIVGNYSGSAYPPKLAYTAYQIMASLLNNAVPSSPGPVHTHVYTPNANNSAGIYDYRYLRGGTIIDVLWVPGGSQSVSFPLTAGKQWLFYTRAGQTFTPAIANNVATLVLNEDPIFAIQRDAPQMIVSSNPLYVLAEQGQTSTSATFTISNPSEVPFGWSASNVGSRLALTPSSGTATPPRVSVRVTVNLSGLPLGVSQQQFTLNGAGLPSQTITVQIRIVPSLQPVYLPRVIR